MELEGYLIMTWWTDQILTCPGQFRGHWTPVGWVARDGTGYAQVNGETQPPISPGERHCLIFVETNRQRKKTQTIKNQHRRKVARPSLFLSYFKHQFPTWCPSCIHLSFASMPSDLRSGLRPGQPSNQISDQFGLHLPYIYCLQCFLLSEPWHRQRMQSVD